MDNVNSFVTFSFLYKFLSSLFCSIFLIYQFSDLLSQYMSGKTVVNIEVKRELYENLPAITLCLPQIVSMERHAKFNPQFQQDYHNYHKTMSKENLLNASKYNDIKPELTEIYWNAYNSVGLYYTYDDFLDLVINNISLP